MNFSVTSEKSLWKKSEKLFVQSGMWS